MLILNHSPLKKKKKKQLKITAYKCRLLALLTEEHHQGALHYKGWDYRDPLDHLGHLGLLDLDHHHRHQLDTVEPGKKTGTKSFKLQINYNFCHLYYFSAPRVT